MSACLMFDKHCFCDSSGGAAATVVERLQPMCSLMTFLTWRRSVSNCCQRSSSINLLQW